MIKNAFLVLFTLPLWILGEGLALKGGSSIYTSMERTSAVCSLTIDRVVVGDCEYGPRTGNKSKVIVAVFLSWSQPIAGEKIQVRLNGVTKLFNPFMKGCPPFVQFIMDPDGASYTVTANFVTGNCVAKSINIQLPLPCDPPVCAGPKAIGGKVFSDFNNNGLQESSENGLPGIEVRLYDDAKQLRAVTTTKTNGLWSIDSLIPGQKLRVEYQVPAGLFDAHPGSENKTRTQIADVGNCRVDLGIYQLFSLIDPDPWMVSTCFVKGDALDSNSPAFTEPTLVANKYSTTEGGPRSGPNGNYYLASAGETGSVWGLSFQKETRQLFSGAFLKRNASLGPGGLGAIYVTDLSGFLPNPTAQPGYRYYGKTTMMINLDSFGIQTGDETKLKRNLPLSPIDASHDSVAFDKIGKWGLGDLDVNDTGDTLYAVNLNNRSLIVIAIGNPLQLPITANRITEIPIPNPGCSTANDWRPWGLKYKDGAVFVGGVCSGESTNNSDDLQAVVYAYANNIFKKVVSFDLNYTKGFLNANYCSTFRPWNRDFYFYYIGSDVVCGPAPVLSDIEFDSEGNMIVSLGDRYGYQTGGRDYGTNTKDLLRYVSFAGGDNLKLFKLKNEYLLEQNATSGFYTTQGANNQQGVCGGEFYFQDGFYSHQESALGALAAHPSYNTIVATLMDPANIWSNGWSQLDNSLGTKLVNYNIFTGEYGTFGKAAGLGDIELLIGSSTPKGIGVSIGNYIWKDFDQDGVQDPGESPMVNVPVLLYNQKDSLIQQTASDTNGLYYFRNLDPYTEYVIQIGADTNYINRELILNNIGFAVTTFQSRINFGNSENDSDASLGLPLRAFYADKIALNYLSGKDGENNFSLDFGLLPCDQVKPDTAILKFCLADSIKIGDVWFSASHLSDIVKIPNTRGFGCDSIVVVNGTLLPQTNYTLDTSVCDVAQIVLHNQTFDRNNPSGVIVLPGANQYGCDSIIQVKLSIFDHSEFRLDTSICPGGNVLLYQQVFDENNRTGSIVLSRANHFGCDSILNVNLRIRPEYHFYDTVESCVSYTWPVNGKNYIKSGSYRLDTQTIEGCDSIYQLQLNINPEYHFQDTIEGCVNYTWPVNGNNYTSSGSYRFDARTIKGCDSTHQLQLIIHPEYHFRDTVETCVYYTWPVNGIKYTNSGNYRFDTQTYSGCDSTRELQLIVHPEYHFRETVESCVNYTWPVTGNNYRSSGNYQLDTKTKTGCDSTYQLQLIIHPEYHFRDTIESCVSYTWYVNGNKYLNSGSYHFDSKTNKGCDSTHQLQLTIHPEFHFSDTICALDRYYWSSNDQLYEQSGVYDFNYRTTDGCDSIEYLVLLIAHAGEVYVPNAFSPNGDQINDRFFVFSNEDVHMIDVFAVYNRWGELVFEQYNIPPNDPQYGWNGIFHDQPANPAVFVYRVEWRDKLGGRHKAKGNVTLIR